MYRVIVAAVLSVCVITSVCASASEDNKVTEVETSNSKTQVIAELGLMNKDERGGLNLDKKITRAELAIVLYNIVNYRDKDTLPDASMQLYKDVDQWHSEAGYIQYLSRAGIMNGYDDQTFHPDQTVTLTELYKVILCIAGYRDYAEIKGGYPSGYTLIASDKGLSDGISVENYEAISRQEVVNILYNMLFVQVLYGSSIGEKGVTYEKSEEFLTKVMDLYYGSGIVMSVGVTSINSDGVAENKAEIDGFEMENKVENLEELLGYNVKYFYSDIDSPILRAVAIKSGNKILSIDSDKIVSYADKKYVYETNDDGDNKTVEMIQGVDVLYNNRCSNGNMNFFPDYGKITLIDHNNDGKFEVVKIDDYTNVVVDTVNKTKNIIYGKNKNELGNKFQIDLNLYHQYKMIDAKGDNVLIENIKSGSILTTQTSDDNKYILIQVSNETVDGVIASIEDDKITIGDEDYSQVKYTYTEYWNNATGVDVKLSLDINGKIGAISVNNEGTWKYAYLINSAEKNSLSGDIKLKLLDQDGYVSILNCDNNLLLDKIKPTSNSEIMAKLTPRQVIRYKKSSGVIKAIDTATVLEAGAIPATPITSDLDDCLLKRVEGTLQYKPVANSFKRYTTEAVDGEAVLNDSSIIFSVPPESYINIQDKDYTVIKKAVLRTDAQLKILAYNTDPNMLLTQAIAVEWNEDFIVDTQTLFLVDKVTSVKNINDDLSYKISGILKGEYTSFVLKNPSRIVVNDHQIRQGDVLRFSTATNGELANIVLVYSRDNKGKLNNTDFKYQSAASFDANLRIVLGYASKVKDNIILFKYFDGAENKPEFFNTSGFKVYIYDANGEDNKKVYVGSAGDIKDYEMSPSNYDYLIVNTRATSPLEIIIIKK